MYILLLYILYILYIIYIIIYIYIYYIILCNFKYNNIIYIYLSLSLCALHGFYLIFYATQAKGVTCKSWPYRACRSRRCVETWPNGPNRLIWWKLHGHSWAYSSSHHILGWKINHLKKKNINCSQPPCRRILTGSLIRISWRLECFMRTHNQWCDTCDNLPPQQSISRIHGASPRWTLQVLNQSSRRIRKIFWRYFSIIFPKMYENIGDTSIQGYWLDPCRRKFRSQTSDNMDRWKAEQGRGREEKD